jgi:hypothetical protein
MCTFSFVSINIFFIYFILFYVLWFPLNIMENSMDVKIFFKNKLVPLILCVVDVIVVVYNLIFLTNFKFQIKSSVLERIILNFMGKLIQVIL